jgi:hypothetical protein
MTQDNKTKNSEANVLEVKVSRTAETILGILGGLFGILGSFFALSIGGIGAAFGADGASDIVNLAWVAILLSIVGLIGGAIASRNAETGGIMMVVCGIGGFIAISMGYIIAGPLLIIGGVLALTKK